MRPSRFRVHDESYRTFRILAGEEKEFNFVIKSPPKTTFMKQLHKLSRPFFNEVSFYLELMHQLTLAEQTDSPSPLERILPVCYHAHSSYYANHEGTGTW